MPLRGNTQDFGLADVLQLIQQTHKTGFLRCEEEVDLITVTFQDGWVTNVELDGRPNDAKLGTRMADAGLINQDALGHALSKRAQTGQPIAQILVDGGVVDAGVAKQYATILATDSLFEIFTWKEGTYELEEGPVPPPNPWFEPLSADYVLMQAIVLMDEWPKIQERIPNYNYVVDRRWAIPPEREVTPDDLFGGGGGDQSQTQIGANERYVHHLCEPGTLVQTVIDRSPFNRYETSRCISALIGEHFVRLAPRWVGHR